MASEVPAAAWGDFSRRQLPLPRLCDVLGDSLVKNRVPQLGGALFSSRDRLFCCWLLIIGADSRGDRHGLPGWLLAWLVLSIRLGLREVGGPRA